MFGSNTERVIQSIDQIIAATGAIHINPVSYRMTHTLISDRVAGSTASSGGDSHSHDAGSLYVWNPQSREDPHPGFIENISDLKAAKSGFDSLIQNIQLIDTSIYVRTNEMHDSIGSPYTELYRLQQAIDDVISFSRECQYMGEYVAACCEATRLLVRVTQLAIDAKWAVINFGDYFERGYNYIFGENPDTTK